MEYQNSKNENFPKNTFYTSDGISIYLDDTRRILSEFPEKSFQSCITSPPYWGLRDYNHDNQIGSEENVNDYISDLVHVFRDIRHLLADDGTFWLNIGDAYTSGGRTWRAPDRKNPGRAMTYRPKTPEGLKPKDLIGLPWRLAFALQEDGWYLRSDIIWNKPNCQPESVKDRLTRSHEYIFLFSKSKKYLFNQDAIKEPSTTNNSLKNRRSVWNLNTEGFKGAHFAVFPESLVQLCLLAGSNEGHSIIDPFLGSGTVGAVSKKLNRNCVGIEINESYANIAKERIDNTINYKNLI